VISVNEDGMQTKVQVTLLDDGVQINLVGDRARRFDAQLIEDCLSRLFACAEANGCLEGGLTITSHCIKTLVEHDIECGCMSRGFGLVEVEPSGP
jgi:hypothetical protein